MTDKRQILLLGDLFQYGSNLALSKYITNTQLHSASIYWASTIQGTKDVAVNVKKCLLW